MMWIIESGNELYTPWEVALPFGWDIRTQSSESYLQLDTNLIVPLTACHALETIQSDHACSEHVILFNIS